MTPKTADRRPTRVLAARFGVHSLRAPGRPVARWEDSLTSFMKGRNQQWRDLAQDREAWASLEDEFVKAEA